MTTRSRTVAARSLPSELLFLIAEILANSGARKSLLEMTLMSHGARELLLPALLRDMDLMSTRGGSWNAARLCAFLASPRDCFRHIKSLTCDMHGFSSEDDVDTAGFTVLMVQFVVKCAWDRKDHQRFSDKLLSHGRNVLCCLWFDVDHGPHADPRR